MGVFVALEPVTQGTPAGVVHHAVGAVLHDWAKFSAPVRIALLNHGSVGEVQLQGPEEDDAVPPPIPDEADGMPVDLPSEPMGYPEPPPQLPPSPDPEQAESDPVAPLDVDILPPEPQLPSHPMEELPHSALPTEPGQVTCPQCPGLVLKSRRALGQHVRRHHPR